MRPLERDVLKVVLTTRMGTLKRNDQESALFIQLVPLTKGRFLRSRHICIGGCYRSALEYLVGEGYLSTRNSENNLTYCVTPYGERFIGRFSKRLSAHQFVGCFKDAVQDAKVARLRMQIIYGTVHTALSAQPLGDLSALYTRIDCYPPAKQRDGIVACAYIIGSDLHVNEGDAVSVKFDEDPYYISTDLTPRWAGRRI